MDVIVVQLAGLLDGAIAGLVEIGFDEAQPLAVGEVRSSYFDDRSKFPEGSAIFDCALLMRGIEHEWHSRESINCGES